jgi:hypothetical protein
MGCCSNTFFEILLPVPCKSLPGRCRDANLDIGMSSLPIAKLANLPIHDSTDFAPTPRADVATGRVGADRLASCLDTIEVDAPESSMAWTGLPLR